jgi:tetratricopeptide (TPR) repeat protein
MDFNLHIPAIGYTVSILGAMAICQSGKVREVRIRIPVKKYYYAILVILTLVTGIIMARPILASRLLVRGEQTFQQGRLEETERYYERAIKWNSLNSIYHANLGTVYWAQYSLSGKLPLATSAMRETEEAIALSPRIGGYYQQLGSFYYHIYRHHLPHPELLEKAISLYQSALRYQPYQPFCRLELARLYYENNYGEQAREELEKLVIMEPNYVAAHYYLGVLYQEIGRQEEAKRYFLQAEQILEKRLRPVTEYEKKLLEFDSQQLYDKLNLEDR